MGTIRGVGDAGISDQGADDKGIGDGGINQLIKLVLVAAGASLLVFAVFCFAIPFRAGGARPWSNDSEAIATMEYIAAAQQEFQARSLRDLDGDGIGEFGYFRDLAKTRDSNTPPELAPLLIGGRRSLPVGTVVMHRGFYFQMFLPNAEGDGIAERDPAAQESAPNAAEASWRCYAWPVTPNNSGKRVLFVDETGIVKWRYFRSGFREGSPTPRWDDAVAVRPGERRCRDGHFWRRLR